MKRGETGTYEVTAAGGLSAGSSRAPDRQERARQTVLEQAEVLSEAWAAR